MDVNDSRRVALGRLQAASAAVEKGCLTVEDIVAMQRAAPKLGRVKFMDPDPARVGVLKRETDLGVHAGDHISFIHLAFGGPDYGQALKTVLHHRGVINSEEGRLQLLTLHRFRRLEFVDAL
jgi:hypothetical protein